MITDGTKNTYITDTTSKDSVEIPGSKQEVLAFDLGEDYNQKNVSLPEQNDTIEELLLRRLSELLKIPVEAFRILMKSRQYTLYPILLRIV